MKVLIIAPYANITPPQNGGMHRCVNLIDQVSKFAETTVISFQSTIEWIKHPFKKIDNIHFISVEFFKINNYNWFKKISRRLYNAIIYRIIKRQIKGPADINLISYYSHLIKVLKSNEFDFVILENLSSLNAVSIIRRNSSKSKIIYDAHNFEINLTSIYNKRYKKLIINKEQALHNTVDKVWVCSEIDNELFQKANNYNLNSDIIPNGTVLFPHFPITTNKKYDLLFCGSLDYKPNEEGLIWFIDNCWPFIKSAKSDCNFIVVGSGNLSFILSEKLNTDGIIYLGTVDDVSEYYNQTIISIVPLLKGSGTRLKILEAMSLGIPVISTSKGAEGIECRDEENILIADSASEFTSKILSLLANEKMRQILISNANLLVKEKYDWDFIGKKIEKSLQ